MSMTVEECFAHVGDHLSSELKEYATDVVFKRSRYIFTTRKGKRQFGYCTHCKQDFQTERLRHNQQAKCPGCGSLCTVKAGGLKRSTLIDRAMFTFWRKSAIDPNVIVAIGTYASRDYRGDYRTVETKYATDQLCAFRAGEGGVMLRRWSYFGSANGELITGRWEKGKTVRCYFYPDHYGQVQTFYSRESLAAAVSGTPFQYSTWEKYDHGDMTMFMDLFARYPCVEYLTKLRFTNLVNGKLNGVPTYSAINWRGNEPHRVLRLSKQDFRALISSGTQVTFSTMKLMQLGRRDGSNFSLTEAAEIANTYHLHLSDLFKVKKYARLRRIVNYMARQSEDPGCHIARNPYRTPAEAFQAWHDYVNDCARLEMDLTSESVLFPRSLHFSHQNTLARRRALDEQIRARTLAEQDQKRMAVWKEQDSAIQKQAKRLAKMQFEQGELILRPIASRDELVAEGKALNHCVANYAEQYATGKTSLLVVRRKAEPDKPFYTVEIHNGRVTQCYGTNNCRATEEVMAFMNTFKAVRFAAKSAGQEVAN